jgi:hypothetical protein
MSFSGCAWLFTYHLGVAKAAQETSAYCRQSIFLGSSAGAIAALCAAVPMNFDDSLNMALDLARDARKRWLGPVFRMSHYVRHGLQETLPTNAYQTVQRQLRVSVTRLPSFRNELIPARDLASNDDLLNLILSSCYIPLYYEKPARFRRRFYCDGGASNNIPTMSPFTIKVCPTPSLQNKQHKLDIYPPAHREPSFRYVLFPDPQVMTDLYQQGQDDFHRFWQRFTIWRPALGNQLSSAQQPAS